MTRAALVMLAGLTLSSGASCSGDERPPPGPAAVPTPPPRTLVVAGSNVCGIESEIVRCCTVWTDVRELEVGCHEVSALAGSSALAFSNGSLCGASATGALTCLPARTVNRPVAHFAAIHGGVVVADTQGAVWRLADGDAALVGTPHLTRSVMVAAPYDRVCSLSRDGRVACLLDHDLTVPPVELPVRDVVRIADGWPFCLVRVDGTVLCDRHIEDTEPTFDQYDVVPGLEQVVDVVSGYGQACVRLASGAVRCFRVPTSADAPWEPGPVLLEDAVELAEGPSELRCARRRSGQIVCWGHDGWGLLHDSRPVDRVGIDDAVDVALADQYGCAATRAGTVLCWGGIDASATTTSATPFVVTSATPVRIDVGIDGAVDVEVWDGGVCARSEDGEVGCASASAHGRATWVPEGARVSELAERCARTDRGDVYCVDSDGRPVAAAPILVRTSAIARLGNTLCGLRGDGLGCADARFVSVYDPFAPRERHTFTGMTRLSGGGGMAGALCGGDAEGGWRCWGSNEVGQLGAPPTRSIEIETPVTFPSGPWDRVVVGRQRTCAWRGDEPLRCAGVDANGHPRRDVGSGDGSLVVMPDVHHVRALALSFDGALAVVQNGRVLSWGHVDPSGALGGGDSTWVETPRVLVLGEGE